MGCATNVVELVAYLLQLNVKSQKFKMIQTNNSRCRCGFCQAMPTEDMSVCCTECPKVGDKIQEYRAEVPEKACPCITLHPGSQLVEQPRLLA